MSTLTIRNMDPGTHARLRERAARSGRSVEAEVRALIAAAVDAPNQNLLLELHDRVRGLDVELTVPPRVDGPREVELP